MHRDVLACLRCPSCRASFETSHPALRCPAGHSFDVARQGYVSFLSGRPSGLVGDDQRMIAARARFLGAGHFEPLASAIAARAADAGPGLAIEVGAGTAYYLARAVSVAPERVGLAVDLSRHAARHAARVHGRIGAIVADVRRPLPVADACAGLVLDVFAPRDADEIRRVLRDDGTVLVVTPTPAHLCELRSRLGLLEVAQDKERRLNVAFEPRFRRARSDELRWTMSLERSDVLALATMGPSARHLDDAEAARRVAALPERLEVTASVCVSVWRPGTGPG